MLSGGHIVRATCQFWVALWRRPQANGRANGSYRFPSESRRELPEGRQCVLLQGQVALNLTGGKDGEAGAAERADLRVLGELDEFKGKVFTIHPSQLICKMHQDATASCRFPSCAW
ncbi:unnamed protein product [Durusdinium trenchii]|uniref:Uncharacterized protein n=2 Tax=Durusdinium trenchii TaxID=1381693 RepID=A0ABP0QHX7_9DINO